ncbi:MAG: zinc ribbon domain-containing protein YjdM [Bacteriovoracaceae bacterium]
MDTVLKCPKCGSEDCYEDGSLMVCPLCFHEWSPKMKTEMNADSQSEVIKDAHGTVLQDGDTVSVIKDLKVKGSSSVVKVGTKVKNIRLVESTDGHNIACRIEGIGQMNLKSEFVKKV